MAQVHRFHDAIAVRVGDGQTVYLSPEIARHLGALLTMCADDIAQRTFTNSNFGSLELDEGIQTDTSDAVKRRKQLR